MRASTSRPSSSVPSRCSALGACERVEQILLERVVRRDQRRQQRHRPPAAGRSPARRRASAFQRALGQRPSAGRGRRGRVETGAEPASRRPSEAGDRSFSHTESAGRARRTPCRRQVDQHEAHRDQQDDALHQRVVAREDRVHHQPPDPRQREDGLGDDGAADQRAQLQPDDRHDRDQRVLAARAAGSPVCSPAPSPAPCGRSPRRASPAGWSGACASRPPPAPARA